MALSKPFHFLITSRARPYYFLGSKETLLDDTSVESSLVASSRLDSIIGEQRHKWNSLASVKIVLGTNALTASKAALTLACCP